MLRPSQADVELIIMHELVVFDWQSSGGDRNGDPQRRDVLDIEFVMSKLCGGQSPHVTAELRQSTYRLYPPVQVPFQEFPYSILVQVLQRLTANLLLGLDDLYKRS